MGVIEESLNTELQLQVLLKAQRNLCGILKREREAVAKEKGEKKEDWWREEWSGLGVSSHREPDRNWWVSRDLGFWSCRLTSLARPSPFEVMYNPQSRR